MSRDFDTIREQVGDLSNVKGNLPGAWWVGTDTTLPMRDEYFAAEKRDDEKLRTIAESMDAHPTHVWMRGGWLMGFNPLDPDNPHKALRESIDISGMWVPNRRSKVGKELSAAVGGWNRNKVRPEHVLTGFNGEILRPGYDSTWMLMRPHLVIREGHYPFLTLGENPDDNPHSSVEIDPDMWERVPMSWLAQLMEEASDE